MCSSKQYLMASRECDETVLLYFYISLAIGVACNAYEIGIGAVLCHHYADARVRPIVESPKDTDVNT